MDAFVKTRRIRKTPPTTWEEQKQGFESCAVSRAPCTFSSPGKQQPTWGVASCSNGSQRSDSSQQLHDGSETSSCFDADTSCNDRQNMCSSPLSDSSYFSSDSDSTNTTLNADAYLPKWLPAPKPGQSTASPLFLLDSDCVALVMTFLEPSEILCVLTMPLSKSWQRNYGTQQDIWKTLCLLEPFKARVGEEADDSISVDDSYASLPVEPAVNTIFGEYRLMFTSFVRCLRYLQRIQEDAQKGKSPSVTEYGQSGFPNFGISRKLKKFLHRRKDVVDGTTLEVSPVETITIAVGISDGSRKRRAESAEGMLKKPKYAMSMITDRLFAACPKKEPPKLQLPSSCAIYTIVNWMVAYPDVEGIQIKCVSTLPVLLEDEAQRLTAQRVGLVGVVLETMLRYPDCAKLHVAAFHAMVLLARPLGGREGMLFDNSKVDASPRSNLGLIAHASSPVKNCSSIDQLSKPKLNAINGIAVMLESMRRFEDVADLQAMACWALVNLALVPAQKTMILSLGGIEVTANAMRRHPTNYNVQFRALFALINLVVASKTPKPLSIDKGPLGPNTEKDVLDATVNDVASLVVMAMKNFCASDIMLNRACLVLHNLAQSQEYLTTILWTPHCYQMLEWCITNYPTDLVLRRSATSTLYRLQVLLSSDQSLRCRFLESIRVHEDLALPQDAPVSVGQHVTRI